MFINASAAKAAMVLIIWANSINSVNYNMLKNYKDSLSVNREVNTKQ